MSAASPAPTTNYPLEAILANDRLISRPSRKANRRSERAALRALTDVLAQGSPSILKRLADLGLKLCEAGTAGVSVLEDGPDGGVFRWSALAGTHAAHEGGSTPGNFSPCGSCLDVGRPMLYAYPARRFTYFAPLDPPIVEGLVVPIFSGGAGIATIWIVSHNPADRGFDAEDVRIMSSLAHFAGAFLEAGHSEIPPPSAGSGSCLDRETIWRGYLNRIARNDQAALDALFREARPLVFSTVLRIIGFPADAEEIATDVFSKIWHAAPTYEPQRGSPVAWIMTIARNLSFERLRSQVPTLHSPQALCMECSPAADPESRCLSDQKNSALHKALSTLPPQQRRAIELAYLSELSHSEIAGRLKEPIGTIKTRIRLGLIRLRASLAAF